MTQASLQQGMRVDHPGVWEQANYAYLHDALISRTATAATLAVLLSHILQRLLTREAIDFVVRMDVSKFDRYCTASPVQPRSSQPRPVVVWTNSGQNCD